MSKNVMIPTNLFINILDTLNSLVPFVPDDLRSDVFQIIWELNSKKHKMELREAYSKIVAAKNTDDRDLARIDYLRLKCQPVDTDAGL